MKRPWSSTGRSSHILCDSWAKAGLVGDTSIVAMRENESFPPAASGRVTFRRGWAVPWRQRSARPAAAAAHRSHHGSPQDSPRIVDGLLPFQPHEIARLCDASTQAPDRAGGPESRNVHATCCAHSCAGACSAGGDDTCHAEGARDSSTRVGGAEEGAALLGLPGLLMACQLGEGGLTAAARGARPTERAQLSTASMQALFISCQLGTPMTAHLPE